MAKLQWPDLTGAQTGAGLICVGHKPSRSKHANRRYVFRDLKTGDEKTYLPHRVPWKRGCLRTGAILKEGLRAVMNQKAGIFDRGGVTIRIVNSCLFLMESGYRDSLWPGYWWMLEYNMDYASSIMACIQVEMSTPDRVAHIDNRPAVELDYHKTIDPARPYFWDKIKDADFPPMTPVRFDTVKGLYEDPEYPAFIVTGTNPLALEPVSQILSVGNCGHFPAPLVFVVDREKHPLGDPEIVEFQKKVREGLHSVRFVNWRYLCFWLPDLTREGPLFTPDRVRALCAEYPDLVWPFCGVLE